MTKNPGGGHHQQGQPLKILMLHGYTQSGPSFHGKTRALIKHIQKLFPLHHVQPVYPTGPIRLNPADIPGYQPTATAEEENAIEAYGWWRKSNTADPLEYVGLDKGLGRVASVIREEGPFDGAIGFSQGACLAAMVASLLESRREEAFSQQQQQQPSVEIPFPESFKGIGIKQPPFNFCICYSGFRAPGPRYRGFYEHPPIQTPVLHILGSLDAIVDESRSRSLIEACAGDAEKEGRVVWHPGGHFLPSQRPFLDAAVVFIREQLDRKAGAPEEDVNDMDLPF